MHFFTQFLSIAAIATAITASALPVEGAENALEKRASPGLYFCKGINYSLGCYKDQSAFGSCVTVGDDFNDQVSSAGPDPGNRCILYADRYCTGTPLTLYNPGSSDLRNQGFNDVMSSFRCYPA